MRPRRRAYIALLIVSSPFPAIGDRCKRALPRLRETSYEPYWPQSFAIWGLPLCPAS